MKHLASLHRFIKVELATMGVYTNLDSNSRKITNTPIREKKLQNTGRVREWGWGGEVEFDPGYFLPKSTIYES